MGCSRFRQWLYLVCLMGCTLSPALAEVHPPFEVTGSVFRNPDGDTIWLDTVDRGHLNIRLSGADTPESGQAYWIAARNYLRTLVTGKPVTAWCYKRDRFEREVCHVRVGNRDVGEALIAEGYAWYAVQFTGELTPEQRVAYRVAEDQARLNRIGLWQDADPMPPWVCRKYKRSGQRGLCR